MTNIDNDLPSRMDAAEAHLLALDGRVGKARSDADAARLIAKGAHDDVATVRVQGPILNAIRQTQLEHGDAIDDLQTKVDHLSVKVDHLSVKFDHLSAKFDHLDAKVDHTHGETQMGLALILNRLDELRE